MRKIFLVLTLVIFSFTNIYALTKKEEKAVNIFMEKVEKIAKKRWNIFRIAIKRALENISKKENFSKNKKEIIEKVLSILDKKIEQEKKIKEEKKKEKQEKRKKEEENSKKNWLNYDFEVVKNYWIELTNTERKKHWLKAYKYSKKLEETAFKWSEVQKSRWKWTHKREVWDSFYNYNKVKSWFAKNWVVCKNISWATFTENVGNVWFTCEKSDCTNSLKNAVKKTFLFYMSEKNKKYRPHYNSVMNKYFNYIWFGISFEKKWNNFYKYYLTVHYCTEIK